MMFLDCPGRQVGSVLLRDFQVELKGKTYAAWNSGAVNVMAVSPTGSGKTVVFCDILRELTWPACSIAHRQELVAQAALALNREEVPHGIIAPKPIIRQIIALEMETYGRSFYSARAPVRVAGVDTLPNHDKKDRWLSQVRLVVQDEGHHVLRDNKWGRAMALFPNARGLFPTAHAIRADGKGLGRHADGLVDQLVVGPSCRELINRGFLTDYRLICPPSDIDISDVPIGATGDFSAPKLRAAVHKSKTIVGDIAAHYMKFAAGKLGITFAVDIEAAGEIAAAYRSYGVPAQIITADTPLHIRGQLMRAFRKRELLQLVSVDVLGEGVDVPAVEVISMARHTASFQVYSQQFGRALRLMLTDEQNAMWDSLTDAHRVALIAASVKPKAIIIDHVNNYQRHGLPDRPRAYTLDRREKRSRTAPDDAIPLRVCLNPDCLQPFERVLTACPYCGAVPVPQRRGSPEHVDGDLAELDVSVLRALRGEIDRIDSAPAFPRSATAEVAGAIKRNHWERQQAQHKLRETMKLWAGWQIRIFGRSEREAQKLFFLRFGIDVLGAQALSTSEAETLNKRISAELDRNLIVPAPPVPYAP